MYKILYMYLLFITNSVQILCLVSKMSKRNRAPTWIQQIIGCGSKKKARYEGEMSWEYPTQKEIEHTFHACLSKIDQDNSLPEYSIAVQYEDQRCRLQLNIPWVTYTTVCRIIEDTRHKLFYVHRVSVVPVDHKSDAVDLSETTKQQPPACLLLFELHFTSTRKMRRADRIPGWKRMELDTSSSIHSTSLKIQASPSLSTDMLSCNADDSDSVYYFKSNDTSHQQTSLYSVKMCKNDQIILMNVLIFIRYVSTICQSPTAACHIEIITHAHTDSCPDVLRIKWTNIMLRDVGLLHLFISYFPVSISNIQLKLKLNCIEIDVLSCQQAMKHVWLPCSLYEQMTNQTDQEIHMTEKV
jgi:hypothetical protein